MLTELDEVPIAILVHSAMQYTVSQLISNENNLMNG